MILTDTGFAKLNLALHVRARRADGRHDIETLFAFCDAGDSLRAETAPAISLTVDGPFAKGLAGDGNLVLHTARALQSATGTTTGAALTLTKHLPVAAGIGGGSADAAATLRLLTRLWGIDPANAETVAPILGADVPACLRSLTTRGEGVGDRLTPIDDLGIAGTPVLLVNPLRPLSTADVFAGWDGVDRGPLGDWRAGRNDLETPARALVPTIGDVLDWLGACPGITAARMSGSGATCFALFDDDAARDAAAAAVPTQWWRMAARLR